MFGSAAAFRVVGTGIATGRTEVATVVDEFGPRRTVPDDHEEAVEWPDPSRLDPWWRRNMAGPFARLGRLHRRRRE